MGVFSKIKKWFVGIFGEEKEVKEEEGVYGDKGVFADFSVRKLQKLGKSSVGITIPKEWLEAHDIDLDEEDKVMVLADSNIVVVNPNNKEEVLERLEGVVDEEGLERLRKDIEKKTKEEKED